MSDIKVNKEKYYRLLNSHAELEAEVKTLTDKILRISAINWVDMGWIHGHQARDAIKKVLKQTSDTAGGG